MYIFRSFYNGGGVALGDINNDNLPDIFFTGNQVPNKLYLNKGDFQFEDITDKAGVASKGVWSSGVSMADVNGDGFLDIYVCKSGQPGGKNRHNELFINNGDLTFTEKAKEYGIAVEGLSIHASFFDYDRDGDLDMYLLNTSFEAIGGYEDITGEARRIPDPAGSDKLYRNDGEVYTEVTEEAGIYSSRIAFGLSASVGDVNRDGWPDIYVANDFFERDYLYLNNKDGTFRDVLGGQTNSISLSSMGSDIADLTNNGWPDIFVADMLPYSEKRKKSKMHYETYSEYQDKVEKQFHYQVTRNTLLLNLGNEPLHHDLPLFSEAGRFSGVEASDWSWSVLLADFDHNGNNDIYITNGIYKDLLDQDYIKYMANPNEIRGMIKAGRDDVIMTLMERMSSEPISNVMFSGLGGLEYSPRAAAWGLGDPGFSSGAAWGDLNRDGGLDLVVSDVNGPARVYRNRVAELHPKRGRLFVELEGEPPNTQGIGAQLEVWAGGRYWYREHMLQRGYQSSMAPGLHVGLGADIRRIDSLRLRWPDGGITRQKEIELPARLILSQTQAGPAEPASAPPPLLAGDLPVDSAAAFRAEGSPSSAHEGQASRTATPDPLLEDITGQAGITWSHRENDYNDFTREGLLAHMRSTEGPALCSGDVNGDGLEDLYIGGARGQAGALLIQDNASGFTTRVPPVIEQDKVSEDTDCVIVELNGDAHPDLYVTSGGHSFSTGSSALVDRLYVGDGRGGFTRSQQMLPTRRGYVSSSAVAAGDMNGDGAVDLFVGERLRLFAVGRPGRGFLLENDGRGHFTEVTAEWAPVLSEAGMITAAEWIDWDADGGQDLVLGGEWMSPRIFRNTGKGLKEITGELGLSGLTGWWNGVHAADLDGNGRVDLVLGNHGLNSQFRASKQQPVRMWVGDFAGTGMTHQILSRPVGGKEYPVALRHELLKQIPSLRAAYPDYASYAGQTVQDILSEEQRKQALVLEAAELGSIVVWNKPGGPRIERLPLRAQLSPIYGIWSADLSCDGRPELLTGGNLREVKPIAGPYDASWGAVTVLPEEQETQEGLGTLLPQQSGFTIEGAARAIRAVRNADGNRLVIVARNDQQPNVFRVRCDF